MMALARTHPLLSDGHPSSPDPPYDLTLYPMAATQVKSLTGGVEGHGSQSRTRPCSPGVPDHPPELILSLSDPCLRCIGPAGQCRASARFFMVSCLRFARDLAKGMGRLPYRSAYPNHSTPWASGSLAAGEAYCFD